MNAEQFLESKKGTAEEFLSTRSFTDKALDFLTMGHIYGEYGPEKEVSFDAQGKMTRAEVPTGDPGFFQDPVTALAMGGAAGVRAASKPLLAAGREALGWFTGGGSEVPQLVKAGAKGITRVAEIPALAETAAKRAGKPFAEVPVKATIAEPVSRVAAEATPRIAPQEIVQPGATSGGKQPWEMTAAEFDNHYAFHATKESNLPSIIENGVTKGSWAVGNVKGFPGDKLLIVPQSELTARGATPSKFGAWNLLEPEGARARQYTNPIPADKITIIDKTDNPHEALIRQALSEGKPVPPSVLKDYPEAGVKSTQLDTLIPEVKGGATGELPKYAEGSAINLERLNTTEDVRQFINVRTQEAEKTIGKHPVTWEQTRAQAEALGWDTKAIRKEWDKKGAFTAAEIDATRQTNLNAITELQQAIKELPYDQTTLTPELRAKVLDSMELIRVTSQAASEAGRALNIHKRILSHDPAFKQASEMERVLKAITGKGTKRTDELINGLRELDFSNTAEVNRFIYNATKTPWQKLSNGAYELWINGLLSNPLTHIVNTTSNALTMAYSYPERLMGAGIEAARAKITGTPRSIFFGETAQDIFSISKGLQDAVARFGHTMRYGERVTKLDYPPSALPDKIARLLPTRALVAEDAFFKGFIENQEMNRLAYRKAAKEGLQGEAFKQRVTNLLIHPEEQMLNDVAKRGQYLTYQKEVGEVGRLIFNARDKVPGLKYFIPFVKTPLNIAKFALERTPLNFGRLAARAAKGELKGAQLSEELAKPIMGTMLGTATYQLAEQGYITGGTPKNAAERNEKLATGWQPYSVKIGDTYYSYGRLEPLGSIMGMAADMSQIKGEMHEKENFNLAAAIMGSITNNISNKTFMQGFTNMIQGISDPGRYGANIVKQLAGSVVPAVSGGVARAIDPNVRDIRSIGDTLQSRIPVAAESLPPKLTVWGDPVERPGSLIGRMLSPMQISQEKGSPIEKELTRLDLDIGYPSRKVKDFEIPAEDYWKIVKSSGEPAKKILDKLATSEKWLSLPDKIKEKTISSVVAQFREAEARKMEARLIREGKIKAVNW
uniref:Putative structural protein n=1 Tax=viral metagenome TaxID=1070528 RepID=A0A6M3J1D8_9ZZZZ